MNKPAPPRAATGSRPLRTDMRILEAIYSRLMRDYGPQGWWPVSARCGEKHHLPGEKRGYHPGDYTIPQNDRQRFEICLGAILTQNTAWTNVEKALVNLRGAGPLCAETIARLSDDALTSLIRPAGYYNQKAAYIRQFTAFYRVLRGRTPSREALLGVRGIGAETADSMLLYAWAVPEFVVDAYTRRILGARGLIAPGAPYDTVKKLFETHLERDVVVYQEYHALLVEHAKRYYRTRPYGVGDPLNAHLL